LYCGRLLLTMSLEHISDHLKNIRLHKPQNLLSEVPYERFGSFLAGIRSSAIRTNAEVIGFNSDPGAVERVVYRYYRFDSETGALAFVLSFNPIRNEYVSGTGIPNYGVIPNFLTRFEYASHQTWVDPLTGVHTGELVEVTERES